MKLDKLFIKKLTGWLIISSCLIMLLGFVWIVVIFLQGYLAGNPNLQIPTSSMIGAAGGLLIVTSLLIFGIITGIKKIKEKPRALIAFPGRLDIVLNGKIKYKDYRNLILGQTFKKPIYFVLLAIVLLFLLGIIANPDNMNNQNTSYYFVVLFLGGILAVPLMTLVQIRKIYKTNNIFKEPLKYILTNESIQIKGDKVDTVAKWAHYRKIKETKTFFMLYQGPLVATLLEKKMFRQGELIMFRRFIQSLKVMIE